MTYLKRTSQLNKRAVINRDRAQCILRRKKMKKLYNNKKISTKFLLTTNALLVG